LSREEAPERQLRTDGAYFRARAVIVKTYS